MRKYYQRRLPENPSKDYYYIMRETPNTTALLIEYGFIDNPNDVKKLEENLLDYVEAVVRAVANYTGTPYTPPGGGNVQNTYTVQSGDTLYQIAQRFGTTVDALKSANNLTSNTLRVGQVLKIPTGSSDATPTPPSSNTVNYTVQRGDSLWEIANRYGTTVDAIKSLNGLTSNTLQIGQVLKIPVSNNYTTYTVKSGDSLWTIARAYNTTVSELRSLNNLTSDVLQIGQQLRIPIS